MAVLVTRYKLPSIVVTIGTLVAVPRPGHGGAGRPGHFGLSQRCSPRWATAYVGEVVGVRWLITSY